MLIRQFHKTPTCVEVGCDEAGRGCLAGPVVAAAVILPSNFHSPWLNDSKKLSPKKRDTIRYQIEAEAIDFQVTFIDNIVIDEINILNASILAMHRALDGLKHPFQHLAIDGNRFNPYKKIPHQCLIKGDAHYMHIAAASILAKTYRDDYMSSLHERFPLYNWCKNKGYPTLTHREAIRLHGSTPHHRKTFKLLKTTVFDL